LNINADNYKNYTFDEDGFLRLQKDLNYGLRHLDSQNVERLFTNQTEIRSENGLTEINGPLLNMYDTNSNLRLRAGYDTDADEFLFVLYNQSGVATIDLSDTGDALVYNVHTSQDVYVGRRIFVDWDSTEQSTDVYLAGFPYQGGLFLRTPTSDFQVSGERHMLGHIISARVMTAGTTVPVSTVWPYTHSMRTHSSGVMSLTANLWSQFIAYGEMQNPAATTGKSTDSIQIISYPGLIYLNTAIYSSQVDSTLLQALYLGPADTREIYVGPKYSSNRMAVEGTQRYYKSKDDLIYFYQRNIRQFDEGHSRDWVTITADANVGNTYRNTIARTRPYVRNSTTGAAAVYMHLTTNEGLVPFDALSFNDGTPISTADDYIVWSFWLQYSSNISSSGPWIHIGNTSDILYEFRCSTFKDGWNYMIRKFSDKTLTQGTPNFNAVSFLRTGFNQDSALGNNQTLMILNFLGVMRHDPNTSTNVLVMQKYDRYNMSWDAVGYSLNGTEVVVHDTELSELSLTHFYPYNSIAMTYLNQQHRDNLSMYLKFIMASTEYSGPLIGQYFDTGNYWYALMNQANIQLYVEYNSSSYLGITRALTDYPTFYSECELWVNRSHSGYVDINFRNNNLYGSLDGYLPGAWYYKRENVNLGNASSTNSEYRVLDLEVRSYDK